jgi:hypothetical protein
VAAANESLGRTIDSSHQIKIFQDLWRAPEMIKEKSLALTMSDGRTYRTKK